MKKLNLRKRFLIPTLLHIFLGMGALSAITYFQAKNALETEARQELVKTAESTLRLLEGWLEERTLNVTDMAGWKLTRSALDNSTLGEISRGDLLAELKRMEESHVDFEGLHLLDAKGNFIASSSAELIGALNTSDRPYFQAAMKGNLHVSQVSESRITGNPVFFISAPVRDGERIGGILLGIVDVSRFSKRFVAPIQVAETGYVYVLDAAGNVLAHPDPEVIMKTDLRSLDFGREILSCRNGIIEYSWDGINKLTAFRSSPIHDWTVAAGAPLDEVLALSGNLGKTNLWITLAFLALAAGLTFWSTHSIVGMLERAVAALGLSSERTGAGAIQIASAGVQLSQNASEQAAAVEETSASLEELAATTRQNAENAAQTESLMAESEAVMKQVKDEMSEMLASVDEIRVSSERTAKILQTIDDIAFQTNLLSLNAAVEAARAGDVGAGFSVVAGEVRNLASRAAEAAAETARLIADTLQSVERGGTIAHSTGKSFQTHFALSDKVGILVREISAASREQADGLGQLSRTMHQMDQGVQEVAGAAQESAGVSEEIKRQAGEMNRWVARLHRMVHGEGNGFAQNANVGAPHAGRVGGSALRVFPDSPTLSTGPGSRAGGGPRLFLGAADSHSSDEDLSLDF